MKFGFSKVLVLLSFSVLQAHNFIPHHHHHDVASHAIMVGQEEEGHHHHHFPFANLHIDEFFFAKIFQIQSGISVAVLPDFNLFFKDNALPISQVFLQDYLVDHPPSRPFLSTFSFRGPPTI